MSDGSACILFKSTRILLLFYQKEKNIDVMKLFNAYNTTKKPQQMNENRLTKLPSHSNQTNNQLSFRHQSGNVGLPLQRSQSPRQMVPSRSKDARVIIQSANVSRQKIEIDDEAGKNLQFSKEHKNRMKILHKRTRSNHIELGTIKEDEMSNFSNSLQNISQEVIQIPFARKIISPSNKAEVGQAKLKSFFNSRSSSKSSLEKRVGSPCMKIAFQRKSNERSSNKQNAQGRYTKYKSQEKCCQIPKARARVDLSLSDFSLKAIKITQGGSIVYLAMHKSTNSIFAIKSIKKRLIRPQLQSFILQLKLGILLNLPNLAKIYGFFTDNDNVYIVKEYLQQGCIAQCKKKWSECDIGCDINQIINGIMSILPVIDCRYWSIQPKNIAQSHGICKITTVKVNLNGTSQCFSERFKHCLMTLIQPQRKSQNAKDIFDTNDSIHLNLMRNGSYLLTNFRETMESILIFTEGEILILWQSQFLRQFRFKALMEEK